MNKTPTYWVDGDDRTFRSKKRAVATAKVIRDNNPGMDICVYRTAYHNETHFKGAHRCVSYEYEVYRWHANFP